MRWVGLWMLLASAPLSGCGAAPEAVVVSQQTLDVGCGTCMFQEATGSGCYWAAKLDGVTYPLRGRPLPSEEELASHGPEGMCTMQREAIVDGSIQGGVFTVTKFELLPAKPGGPKAPAHDHKH